PMRDTKVRGVREDFVLRSRNRWRVQCGVPEKRHRIAFGTLQDGIDCVELLSAEVLHPGRRIVMNHDGLGRWVQRIDMRAAGEVSKAKRLHRLLEAHRQPIGCTPLALTGLNETLGDIERIHGKSLFGLRYETLPKKVVCDVASLFGGVSLDCSIPGPTTALDSQSLNEPIGCGRERL